MSTARNVTIMIKNKAEKRKAKRKSRIKERHKAQAASTKRDQADFYFYETGWYQAGANYKKALINLRKALKLMPNNPDFLEALYDLGSQMERDDLRLESLSRLYNMEQIDDEDLIDLVNLLSNDGQYQKGLEVSERLLALLPSMKVTGKKRLLKQIDTLQDYCRARISFQDTQKNQKRERPASRPLREEKQQADAPAPVPPRAVRRASKAALPDIPVTIILNTDAFHKALSQEHTTTSQRYKLALMAHNIRFRDSFENLICLADLKGVRSFWYQEETARKVLKGFRGRALLSDEVGLGKTIEASIILKEYMQRGMVKSALILTPTPLVSQWQDELRTKFDLDFPSTDDPHFKTKGLKFWEAPFILASINHAKSRKNFAAVTRREYDMVIVDEAHHLKNRNTLNWQLVNSLKNRFLLLLTATPVENNLMELYNLITLLKPGQLKTSSAFRKEFMTKGDPTDPRNRTRLKDLLGQVMIRNTRALAKIDIPPRFAQTIRVDSSEAEKTLYDRIGQLVQSINQTNGRGHKLLLKNLLEEAGSSPRAVGLTLSRTLSKNVLLADYEKEIRAVHDLCLSIGTTSKNKVLYKLLNFDKGKKIVFVKYLGTMEHLSDYLSLKQIPHAIFHGGMSNAVKDKQIRSFREEKDILITTEIGGEGRNLQFCHQMINYDLPWNPMKIEQRIGRIHRIGQEKEVIINNLCATGSIEDYILDILDRKINMFEMVIGEIDMILGRVRGEKDFSETVFDIWANAVSEKEREKGFGQLATQMKRNKTQYEKTKVLDEKLFGENYEL